MADMTLGDMRRTLRTAPVKEIAELACVCLMELELRGAWSKVEGEWLCLHILNRIKQLDAAASKAIFADMDGDIAEIRKVRDR